MVSSTIEYDQIVVKSIKEIIDAETDCPGTIVVPGDCQPCPAQDDTGTGNFTFKPGDGDTLESSCAAMLAYAMAGSIPLVYQSGSSQWKGSVGSLPDPGSIEMIVERGAPPTIGGYCNYNVTLIVHGDSGDATITASNIIGDAKSIIGSWTIDFGPCTDTIKSVINFNISLNPTGCYDTVGEECVADQESDDLGLCE